MPEILEYKNSSDITQVSKHQWLPERTFGTCSFAGLGVSILAYPFLVKTSGITEDFLGLLFWGMPLVGFICAIIGCFVDDRKGWAVVGIIANWFGLLFSWFAVLDFMYRGIRPP